MKQKISTALLLVLLLLYSAFPVLADNNATEGNNDSWVGGSSTNPSYQGQMGQGIRMYVVDPTTGRVVSAIWDLPSKKSLTEGDPYSLDAISINYQGTKMGASHFPEYYTMATFGMYDAIMAVFGIGVPPTTYKNATFTVNGNAIRDALNIEVDYIYLDSKGAEQKIRDSSFPTEYLQIELIAHLIDSSQDSTGRYMLHMEGTDVSKGITPSMIIGENGYTVHIETLLWAKIENSNSSPWNLSWVYGTVTEVGAYAVSQGKTSNYLSAASALSVHSHSLTLDRNQYEGTSYSIRATTQPEYISLNTMSQVDQGHALHIWWFDWVIPTNIVSSTYIDKEYRANNENTASVTPVPLGDPINVPDLPPHPGRESDNITVYGEAIEDLDARFTVTKIYFTGNATEFITEDVYNDNNEDMIFFDYRDYVSKLQFDYLTSRTQMTQDILIEEEPATGYQLAYWYSAKDQIIDYNNDASRTRSTSSEYPYIDATLTIYKNLIKTDALTELDVTSFPDTQFWDWATDRATFYQVPEALDKAEKELQTMQILTAIDVSLRSQIGMDYEPYIGQGGITASHHASERAVGTGYFDEVGHSSYSRSVDSSANYNGIDSLRTVFQTLTPHANIQAEYEHKMIRNPGTATNWEERELVLIFIKSDDTDPDWTSTYIDEEYRGTADAKTTPGQQVPVPDVPPDPRVDSPNYDLGTPPPDTWTNDIVKVYRKEVGTDSAGNPIYTHVTTEWREEVPNYVKVENEYGTPYGVIQWYTTDESIEEIGNALSGGLDSTTEYGDIFDITFNSKSNITNDIVEVGHSAPAISDIVMDSDKNYYSGTTPESENIGIPSSTVYSDTFTDLTGKQTLVVLLEIDNSYTTSTLKDDPQDTPPSTPSSTPDEPPGLGDPDHPWHPYNPFDPTDPTLVYNITKTYREKELNTGDITHISTFKLDKQPPTIEIEDEIVETGYALIEWYLSSCTDPEFGTIASGNTWEDLTTAYDSLHDGTGETTIKVSNTVDATTLHLLYEKIDYTIPLEGDNKIIITESALTKAVETTDENDVIVADPTDPTAETNWGKVTLPWSFVARDEDTDALLSDYITLDNYSIAYKKLNFKYLYDMTTSDKTPSENVLASKLDNSGAFDLVYSNFYNTSFKVNDSNDPPSLFLDTYYNYDNRYGINMTLWRGEDRPTLASYKTTDTDDKEIKALLGTTPDKLPDTSVTRAADGSEEFDLPLEVLISTDSDLIAEDLTSDRYMTAGTLGTPEDIAPDGTTIPAVPAIDPKHNPLYLEFAIEDDEIPDYKAIVEVQTFKGVDHVPGTESPTDIAGTFHVIDTVKVKYFPFITMSYQETNTATTFTSTSAKDNNPAKSEVKVISTHESEIDLHSAFRVSWGRTADLTEPNLLLTSTQWSIHNMATNSTEDWKLKDNVLPGGAFSIWQ